MPGRDANDLLSMRVIATSEGRELGKVKDAIFDPEQHALLGLVVTPNTGIDTTRFLPKDSIVGIGNDAVTVASTDVLMDISTYPRAQEIADSGVHLRGASIMTETGDAVGTVDKILIDETGDVTGYQASSGFMGFGGKTEIAPSDVISVGQDAIVVSDAAFSGTEGDTTSEPE